MEDFENEMKLTFIEEVTQLLSDSEQCFLQLEENPDDSCTIDRIFRIAHNIKGSAKAVGFEQLGQFTHEFENFLLQCKSKKFSINSKSISLLLKCNDHIKNWIEKLHNDLTATVDSANLINELQIFTETETLTVNVNARGTEHTHAQDHENESEPEPESEVGTIPNSQKNTALVNKNILQTPTSKGSTDESIRVSLSRLEGLLNSVGELVILQTVLKEQAITPNPLILKKTIHQMGKITKEVQEISMSLRMVPLKQTFQKMQRIVRDTSHQLNKKVNLILEGEDTKVDKTILEALSDPLVHIIRNAVDHGIEPSALRKQNQKDDYGTIILKAYHQSGKLIIEVTDDGGGISIECLKLKAVERGVLKPNQVISDKEAVNLIFHLGLSTKTQVTDVSGRGVGMDVVKTNIEQIQGEVLVETTIHQGTTFKIVLPLTLAIIDGMIIRCNDERFVIPLSHVYETVKIKSTDIKFIIGVGEILDLRNENLPVIRLNKILGNHKTGNTPTEAIAIVVRDQGTPFATLAEDIIGQHQVVIKKLGHELQLIKGYSGSAILGDGKPALILEMSELLNHYGASKDNLTHHKRQVAL